ncbi:phosphoribosylamine--glycine ligase [Acidobacteria bacterium ACD]|nr:MAG: phosphoribosylamine--glycine ligase [Acidobacteriota bacterium]MCE7957724.1 phosphoribosylamine--glycine ligase [Acidobacteria bacterium ACB2]MDL1948885.1 phosphoribosylamine--glycine ligase [Acidobacteria bacterium ACD]
MRVFVVGSGGREHALVWKLSQSPGVKEIFCAPGNAGIGQLATCFPIGVSDIVELADFAEKMRVDLTVVGPELPLALGLVDELTKRGLLAFGPNKLAAELEGSKVFSKSFLKKYGIPTPDAEVCTSRLEAEAALKRFGVPCVFKADGLASGKGVVVVHDRAEAERALKLFFEDRVFGSAGNRVLVERFVDGDEVTFMVLCDGEKAIPLATAKDYKRVFDGDRGPNTGGMGSHSPSVLLDAGTARDVLTDIVQPTLKGMAQEGRTFRGLLFVGLTLENGLNPLVLEFNVRFGDPETQSILIRMEDDLLPYLVASAKGAFDPAVKPVWKKEAGACLVLSAEGYPGPFERGKLIEGIEEACAEEGTFVFHAGTARTTDGKFVTAGGRVLNVCARARGLSEALRKAIRASETIRYDGKHFRRDIGAKALEILRDRTASGLG